MPYRLEAVTFSADMSPEGMAQVTEIWNDIATGKLPLMMSTDGAFAAGLVPVTEYLDYAGVNYGEPITTRIRMVGPDFFAGLDEDEENGIVRRFELAGDTIDQCSAGAWDMVQAAAQAGELDIDYDYAVESTVPPDIARDGRAHCTLYLRVL